MRILTTCAGIIIVYVFSVFSSAHAQSPSIATFVASPATAASGDIFNFAWALENAGGYSFSIPCYTGITFKPNGFSFTCGSKISTTAKINDTLTFYI